MIFQEEYYSMKLNKFIATAATATLVATAIVPVASAADFSDIKGNTHAEAIKTLADQGIINGYTDGTFKPNQQINRGQTVKLLGRWLEKQGYEIPTDWDQEPRFKDLPVTADEELVKYAALVKDAGVFNGSNGNLNYNQPMQRQQMATVLVRAIETILDVDLVNEYKSNNFQSGLKDLNSVFADHRESVVALEYAGITQVENFNPANSVTRGQFASFLNRTINMEAPVEELKVMSVQALNSTAIEVVFSQPIDDADENLKKVRVTGKTGAKDPGTLSYGLSEDGKVLTITSDYKKAEPKYFEGDYIVAIDDETVKGENGEFVPEFETSLSFASDEEGPTLEVVRVSSLVYKVKFSEPVRKADIEGNFNFKNEDGESVSVDLIINDAQTEVTLIIPNDDIVEVDEKLSTVITGIHDIPGNLMDPVSIDIVKGDKDGEEPSVEKVEQTGAKTFTVKVSEELLTIPTVTFGDEGTEFETTVTVDKKDPTLLHVTTKDGQVIETGKYIVRISKLVDLSGQSVDVIEVEEVEFEKDSNAPEVATVEVVKDEENVEFLQITFNKNVVVADDAKVTATGEAEKNGVVTPVEQNTGIDVEPTADSKVVRIQLNKLLEGTIGEDEIRDIEGAVYQLDLTVTGVKSEYDIPLETVKVEFIRGNDTVETPIAVDEVVRVDNDTIEVIFTDDVDGNSATVKSNYRINGKNVKDAVVYSINTKKVILTLEEGSIPLSGKYNLEISGVKAEGSNLVMEPKKVTVDLIENIAPYVESAELHIDSDELTITFSEPIKLAKGEGTVKNDFEVLVDGKVKVVNENQKLAIDVNNKVEAEVGKTVTITLNGLTNSDKMKTITLAGLEGSDIVDVNGNKVKFQEEITVSTNSTNE